MLSRGQFSGFCVSWMAAASSAREPLGDLEPRLQLLRGHAYYCLPATTTDADTEDKGDNRENADSFTADLRSCT